MAAVSSNKREEEKEGGGKKKYQKSYFDVLGICCPSEVSLIEGILKPLEGVKELSVIVPSKTVIVIHDNLLISQTEIVKVLNGARLEANVRAYGKAAAGDGRKRWPSQHAIACGVLWLVALWKFVWPPLQWVALGAVAFAILPIALRALAALKHLRLDINVLVLVAVTGTIALKDYLEAATIVFLFTIAEWLQSMASHKATDVMSSLMSIAPQKAVMAETGEVVAVENVAVSSILAVKAGETIPIDGVVVDGNSEVDEKTLTGESFPVAKEKDSPVWAGTINLNGYISVKTTALAEDCIVSQMTKLVEEAQNRKTKTQRLIDNCAKYYTPLIVFLSVGLAGIPAAMRAHDRNHWFHIALVVLVSGCPCGLVLSTPVASFCALSKAATAGLLIKGGDYLETLAKIKTVAFDKTGTITRGEFVVTDFRSLSDNISLDTLLYWVSSIESKSSHVMASTLLDYAQLRSIKPRPENVEDFRDFPGEGIYGNIDGKGIHIGNQRMAARAGCTMGETLESDEKTGSGSTIGRVYSEGACIGTFSLTDGCRSGVAEAIRELKAMGVKSFMLTGDSHAAATCTQHQLGDALDGVHAELLPQDKAEMVKAFQTEGPTAMVGDGLNDALALATADIGISMGISGSALATDTGHIILMSNDIGKIPKAARLARRTQRKIVENIVLSILTKAAVVGLTCAGHPLVWVAVLADVGTCLAVILNSMLLQRGGHGHKASKHGHGEKGCCEQKVRSSRSLSDSYHHHHHRHRNGHCHSGSTNASTKNHEEKIAAADTRCESHHHDCSLQICASQCQPNCSISSPCRRKKCTMTQDNCAAGSGLVVPVPEAKSCSHVHVARANNDHGHKNESSCGVQRCGAIEGVGLKTDGGGMDSAAAMQLQACRSLERREMGGCCKSFREECCGKHGYGLGGGLSEIVIE